MLFYFSVIHDNMTSKKWATYDFLLLYWEYYIYWYEFILHYITKELFRSNQQAIVVNQQLDIKIKCLQEELKWKEKSVWWN